MCLHVLASKGNVLHGKKVNERWRVALAGLVAALAIPFLIVDSPAPAEGVETKNEQVQEELGAPIVDSDGASEEVALPSTPVEVVVIATEIAPDVSRLADQSGTWRLARAQAVADGRVAASFTRPPSETNYSLLPVVKSAVVVAPETAEVSSVDEVTPEPQQPTPGDVPPEEDSSKEPAESTDVSEPAPEDGDGKTPEPTPDEIVPIGQPPVPAQVDGRVPPPPGGPTAAQWNALRKCESTHNYAAISPSGLYRGAYQFSQQTWDWVAGIYHPHLVSIDPIDSEPAWQDVMAYTLYAMRGWDQWPICGKNLL